MSWLERVKWTMDADLMPELIRRLEIAERALEFYADRSNYNRREYVVNGYIRDFIPMLDDGFDTADKALTAIREEPKS